MKRRRKKNYAALTDAQLQLLRQTQREAARIDLGHGYARGLILWIDAYVEDPESHTSTPSNYLLEYGEELELEIGAIEQDGSYEAELTLDLVVAAARALRRYEPHTQQSFNPKHARRGTKAQVRRSVQRCMADRKWKQRLPGGTKRHPSSFDFDALVAGTMVEREHTSDVCIAMEIAMDHLDESPTYYDDLRRFHLENPQRHTRECGSGCVLAKWASAPGSEPPPPVRSAARELATKRWTLSPREARIKASLLR